MPIELWPPLSVIRSHFELRGEPDAQAQPVGDAPVTLHPGAQLGMEATVPVHDLLLPLTELARRREAVATRGFDARWAPGRLVSVVHEGRMLGVLLDRSVSPHLWQGWMAASEADWASAFDVLLEPDDEPFEPLFGVIQTWNPVTLAALPQLCARVQGELSATRLAAVQDEYASGERMGIAPEPGRIALRTAGGVFSVLSGTPLAYDDLRADYQAIYRDAALQLRKATQDGMLADDANAPRALAQPKPQRNGEHSGGGAWARVRRWFAADAIVRPAFALLALVVIVQNTDLFATRDLQEDAVQFRSAGVDSSGPRVDLIVVWKAGSTIDETERLLHVISADVVSGPDSRGAWYLRVPDPAKSAAVLGASSLVESVVPP